MSIFEHPAYDNHEAVAFHHDQACGLKAIVAVHNTNLGPSLGGCRMWTYASSEDALTDVLRLSKGMTYKAAMAELKLGGGKAVIIGNPRTDKSVDLMRSMGRFIDSMAGTYITAEDSGIAVSDIEQMAEKTEHVSGIQSKYSFDGAMANGNPAPATAYGVFVGIKTAVQHKLGTELKGVSVAIQGLGHVGYRLAKHLHLAGAKLIVADVFPDNLHRAEQEFSAKVVAPENILQQEAEVLSPCALGAVINDKSIEDLKATIIAGAANNQLLHEEHGELLRQKGVLYAPDYVINAGGVIDIYHQRILSSPQALKGHIERIGDNLQKVFVRSENESVGTNYIANKMAEERFGSNG